MAMSDNSDEYVCMTPYLKSNGRPTTVRIPNESLAIQFPTLLTTTKPLPASTEELSEAEPTSACSAPTLPAHELGFAMLVKRFSSLLPQRVQVTRAVYTYGENEDALLAQDDVYDIHFVRHRKTVALHSPSGAQYHVPINCTLKFGLVYEQDRIFFPSINDIIEAETKPKVVCAQKTYIGSTPEKSVCTGEILAIGDAGAANGCSFLTVYSFACKKEKQLPFFCTGNFTTNPIEVQLPLLEIVGNVSEPFPYKVLPFAGTSRSMASDFSQAFFNETYNMVDLSETATIVASPQLSDVYSGEIEISINPDVKIKFIKLTNVDMALLKANTQSVLQRYDETRIEHLWQASNFDHNRCQSQLYKHVHSIRDMSSNALQENSDDEIPTNQESLPTRLTYVYNGDVAKDVASLKETCDNFRRELQSLRGDVNLMQSQLTKLWEAVTPNHKGITTLTFSAEENIQHLCTFSQEQVLLLLATLKLEQYCEIFAAERIDGKMLAEMDEDVLKEDLGVASKLHRIRLLIVINGQQRAETNL